MIGTMLKEYRLRKGFTQKYVAHVLGITSKAYSKIETGVNSLDVSYIVPVCDLLDIPYLNMYAEIFGKLYTDHDDYNNSDNYIFVDGEQRTLSGKPVKNIMTPSEYAVYQPLCTAVGEGCSKQVVLINVEHVFCCLNHFWNWFVNGDCTIIVSESDDIFPRRKVFVV